MPKRIILIRHGETDHNLKGVCQGWLDVPLNRQGLQQAQKLAQQLKEEVIDAIYTSDLKRTLQTAIAIATTKNLRLFKSKKIREFNFGILQGKTWDDIRTNYHHLISQLDDHSVLDFKDHLGESRGEFRSRLSSFLSHLDQKHSNQSVAVITHGGAKRVMLDLLGYHQVEHGSSLGNTSVTILEKDKLGKYKLIKFNDTSHLDI